MIALANCLAYNKDSHNKPLNLEENTHLYIYSMALFMLHNTCIISPLISFNFSWFYR